jgi:hypothetical protein
MSDSQTLFRGLDAAFAVKTPVVNGMSDSQLIAALEAEVTDDSGAMGSSGVLVAEACDDRKESNVDVELELLGARISDLQKKVLDLQKRCASPDADKIVMRAELGDHVQSLRKLHERIIKVISTVRDAVKQSTLDDASRRVDELFDGCLECLHSIEPPSAWAVVRFVQSFLARKPNAVEELRKAFPQLA